MTLGAWVLVTAVVMAVAMGLGWTLTNGVFRGTRRVRGVAAVVSTSSTDGQGSIDGRGSTDGQGSNDGRGSTEGRGSGLAPDGSVLGGTAYAGRLGERATLLQFSSAFCAPCRATRRVLSDVATSVPGVNHVEVDAEHHLDLVRALGVLRTPTTLVLDADGREVSRAAGTPRAGQVLAALEGGVRLCPRSGSASRISDDLVVPVPTGCLQFLSWPRRF
jgi:thiol-disulfide isomerase/thioredoxin